MERQKRFSTIIVALDGTRETERILGPATDLAATYGAGLVLVRALERHMLPPNDDPANAPGVAVAAGPLLDSSTGIEIPTIGTRPGESFTPPRPIDDPEAAGYLNILDHELEDRGLQVEYVDPDGDPAEAIVAEASARGADLIVMGTRQRKGWERLFKGSTAERVLRDAPCAVLVVPLD